MCDTDCGSLAHSLPASILLIVLYIVYCIHPLQHKVYSIEYTPLYTVSCGVA